MIISETMYRASSEYRVLADAFIRLEREHGALRAAYGNAINDQHRLKDQMHSLGGAWDDDPGRGGSGGAR